MKQQCIIGFLLLTACAQPKRADPDIYMGADLSYVNEMMDCGGRYRENGTVVDAYELFAAKGANIVRLRLWHTPDWTDYSDFDDVKKSIRRSKENGMQVLLDFHYSDTWADPDRQIIPEAWSRIDDLAILQDSVYEYTRHTLQKLHHAQLLPDFVQIGNEINIEMLQQQDEMVTDAINWHRNALLINEGLRAIRDFSKSSGVGIQSMLHIAQPEHALRWFREASKNGINDYDWIGLSYYPKWSAFGFDSLSLAIDSLKNAYHKKVMIVETAYPYGFVSVDSAHNILGEDSLMPGIPATPEGQLKFLTQLTQATLKGGGRGVIYWEPAWVSSRCRGSHWENATFFDAENDNEALKAFDFFREH